MNLDELFQSLVGAAQGAGRSLFERGRTVLVPELRHVAERILAIEVGRRAGELGEAQAKELLTMQVESAIDTVAMTTELAAVDAEKLINAALKAVKDAANAAVGFPLI